MAWRHTYAPWHTLFLGFPEAPHSKIRVKPTVFRVIRRNRTIWHASCIIYGYISYGFTRTLTGKAHNSARTLMYGKESIMEPLNNPSLNYQETKKKKCDFSFSYIFNGLRPWKIAIHPCIAKGLNWITTAWKAVGSRFWPAESPTLVNRSFFQAQLSPLTLPSPTRGEGAIRRLPSLSYRWEGIKGRVKPLKIPWPALEVFA